MAAVPNEPKGRLSRGCEEMLTLLIRASPNGLKGPKGLVQKFVQFAQRGMFASAPLPPAHCKPDGDRITPGNPNDIQAIDDHAL